MSEELKPCAHCGGALFLGNMGGVRCVECDAYIINAEAWNLRASSASQDKVVEGLAGDAAVEAVAAECHKQWAGWTEYMMAKLSEDWDEWAPRWRRQIATPYSELPEKEKESDRIEARKILAALARLTPGKEVGRE